MAPMPKKSAIPAELARPLERIQALYDALPPGRRRIVDRLAKADEAVQRAEQARIDRVVACREAGITWDVIALVLHVKQPNATAKYKPYLEGTRSGLGRRPARVD